MVEALLIQIIKKMRSLKRRFENISKANPLWSSYVSFAETILKQDFSKRTLTKHFNQLVKKDDYEKQDKREIIKQLIFLTKREKKDC